MSVKLLNCISCECFSYEAFNRNHIVIETLLTTASSVFIRGIRTVIDSIAQLIDQKTQRVISAWCLMRSTSYCGDKKNNYKVRHETNTSLTSSKKPTESVKNNKYSETLSLICKCNFYISMDINSTQKQ